jgi:hypothetical protein
VASDLDPLGAVNQHWRSHRRRLASSRQAETAGILGGLNDCDGTGAAVPKGAHGRLRQFGLELYHGRRLDRRSGRTHGESHEDEVRGLLEAIRSSEPPMSTSDLVNVSAVTLAIVEPLRTGVPLLISHGAADGA